MALTESNNFEIGAQAPDFNLLNTVNDTFQNLTEIKGEKATVILFICNHCPFVLHINEELMKKVAENLNYSFPYLYDETQEVAKAYDATCTPDIYVFDANLKATYHGQLCDSRPGNGIPVIGKDLRNAIDSTLVNNPIKNQKPSIGCGIKWK